MDFQDSLVHHQCVHKWFECQVEETPDAIAVIYGAQQLSYRQLNVQANQLARHLRALGVQADTLVGICMDRSPNMIIAMLAVLKSGGGYLPLDPTYPRERIELMLEDSQVPVLLTQKKLADTIPTNNLRLVCLDTQQKDIASHSPENLDIHVESKNLAYVIYTSGSTGRPKGVLIENRSLFNFVQSLTQKYEVTAKDRALQFASISFDVAVEEIFVTLVKGATLILRSQEMLRSIPAFLHACEVWNVSLLNLPTAFWHKICAELPNVTIPNCVRLLVIGSERAVPHWLVAWKQHVSSDIRLVNAYGPTEATVGSTLCDLAGPNAVNTTGNRVLPIGKPIDNVQVYVLNEELQPAPFGVAGELYIGGRGLAREYLNRPELTAERFIFIEHPEVGRIRLYKTGDWVRYREDGQLEFLDRIDRQEKIRGFRIELSEIETVLDSHPAVQQAIVLAWEASPGNKRLVAYVIPQHHVNNGADLQDPSYQLVPKLRSYLQGKLPSYMVPAAFVLLNSLPMTPNGKIDRRALPTPSAERPALDEVFVAPLTSVEKKLANMWSAVLSISEVGVNDNFFELGGDSLQTTQLISQIEKDYTVVIQLLDFFSIPTIAGLAGAIQRVKNNKEKSTEHMSVKELSAEVVLDESIQPANLTVAQAKKLTEEKISNPKAIFFTGATGFLGAFLLAEVLKQTQADVYCLVRAEDLPQAWQKLRTALTPAIGKNEALYDRIIPVLGDLGQSKLGMSSVQFEQLTQTIDTIYHCGANVNLLYPYKALYATNVRGTHEVLALASTHHPKAVYYLSTLDVFESLASTGIHEFFEDANIALGKGISGGYAQSKWIAEKMVAEAGKRGLPVSIYRPGMVTGHSQSGYSNTSDIFCRLVKSLAEVKQAPALDLLIDMTPVDYVSRAITSLSLQPASIGKTFHVVNPQPMPFSDIVSTLDGFGCTVERVDYPQWKQTLKRLPNAMSPLAASLSNEDKDGDKTCLELWLGGNDRFDNENTQKGLKAAYIDCPRADARLLKTYLKYYAECGFLEVLTPVLN